MSYRRGAEENKTKKGSLQGMERNGFQRQRQKIEQMYVQDLQ